MCVFPVPHALASPIISPRFVTHTARPLPNPSEANWPNPNPNPTPPLSPNRLLFQLANWHQSYGDKIEILLYPSDEFGAQELPSAQVPAFVAKQGLPTEGGGCTLMEKGIQEKKQNNAKTTQRQRKYTTQKHNAKTNAKTPQNNAKKTQKKQTKTAKKSSPHTLPLLFPPPPTPMSVASPRVPPP